MNNIDDVVKDRLCIGCMACICMCPLGALETEEGDYGFPVPIKHKDCNDCGICLLECPSAAEDDE
ncbi:MAG: 4Fe-4S dicluster domain-containing protein [Saccharofermentanales bacterium]